MYKVTELEILHNKRLHSGLIDHVVVKPHSLYQIIIGPNGFGKSAMLDEVTAFPSTGSAFDKGGLSRLKMETDHGVIETKSIFENDGKHEFWLNGENLNDGGTSTVQRDLVEKYLKINKFTAMIQSGQFSFSEAGAAKRQEVLTELVDSDMTFANQLYVKARKKLNQSIGAVNALEESLIEKERRQISEEEYQQLTERLDEYNRIVTEILKEYQEDNGHFIHPHELQAKWDEFPSKLKSNLKYLPTAPLNAMDRTTWVDKINKLKEHGFGIETRKKALQEEYDEIEIILKRNEDASEENIAKLKIEQRYWEQEIEKCLSLPRYQENWDFPGDNLKQAITELDNVLPEIYAVLTEMEPNIDNRFSRASYTAALTTREQYQQRYNQLSGKQSQLLEQLEHLDTGKEVHCPNCQFHFVPGASSDKRPSIILKLEEVKKGLEKGKEAIEENRLVIEQTEKWIGHFKEMTSLIRACPTAALFFEKASTLVDFKEEPLRAIQVFTLLREDLTTQESLYSSKNKFVEVSEVIGKLTENKVVGIDGLKDRFSKIKNTLERLIEEQLENRQLILDAEKALLTADQYTQYVDECAQQYTTLSTETVRSIEHAFNQTRLALIQDLQGHIGTLTKTLNDAKTLRDQIDDTRVQLEKQKERVEGLKLIFTDMSPNSGVVAEQMNEFIRIFISQMNDILAEIWSHPIEILVGKPTDKTLTYTFPIRLHDSDDYIVGDLKMGSDGQKKIFDFAFQVTAMLYLGLVNVPLELDEVDRPLSPVHKAKLMGFIIKGVESSRFSQVFLISHHPVSHGALPFSDIIDFDFRNATEGVNNYATFS